SSARKWPLTSRTGIGSNWRRRQMARRKNSPRGWQGSPGCAFRGLAKQMKFSQFCRAASMQRLKRRGEATYLWTFHPSAGECAAPAEDEVFVRLVTSFATCPDDVGRFLAAAMAAAPT